MQQISGSANVTTSPDGILITKKGEGNDLIDRAIANNGQIPEGVLQPVIQRAPSQQPSSRPTPASSPEATRPRATQTPTPRP
jgi:hypothetical protein